MSTTILNNAASKLQESDRKSTYKQDNKENSVNAQETNYFHEKSSIIFPKVPRLVAVSGTTKEDVEHLISRIEKNRHDGQFLSSINHTYYDPIKSGHVYRGYVLLCETFHKEIFAAKSLNRPKLVFVYPGLGIELGIAAKSMLKLDIFKDSIMRSANYLEPYGIKLINLIKYGTRDDFGNILNSLVMLVAVQIALTDVLKHIGIEPDIIFGHSLGEVSCGYADGALTAKQAVLTAYGMGRGLLDSNTPLGAMAAVSLPADVIERKCPPNVYPVCFNTTDKTTIAGEPENIEKCVRELQQENIFAKVLPTFGYGFHSKYLDNARPLLVANIQKIIPHPKKRSPKWLSTSILERDWASSLAQTCSAEYYVNAVCREVYFYQIFKKLPDNIVTVEICPTGTLQFIIKSNLGPKVPHISLMKKGSIDSLDNFLCSLGKIHNVGGAPRLENIYTPVHQKTKEAHTCIEILHTINFCQNVQQKDATNDGIMYSAAAYLVLIWKILAELKHDEFEHTDILMENIKFNSAPIARKHLSLLININKETGDLKILKGDLLILTGKVLMMQDSNQNISDKSLDHSRNKEITRLSPSSKFNSHLLNSKYELIDCNNEDVDNLNENRKYTFEWNHNWISFIDSMIRIFTAHKPGNTLFPQKIDKCCFSPQTLLTIVNKSIGNAKIPVNKFGPNIKSPGIEITGIKFGLLKELRTSYKHKL
ncbi:fatty acid synthase-like [Diabrotica virgifera virgifera]|uniref:Fatty acid synthase-like n=1 Tax=Diabrotica virgifera virgifera TaxID=50390 RepID=A0A6P7FDH4_DIAVI|nr:fatty acid synthase-like [Diabrotica virgifera virgifera]